MDERGQRRSRLRSPRLPRFTPGQGQGKPTPRAVDRQPNNRRKLFRRCDLSQQTGVRARDAFILPFPARIGNQMAQHFFAFGCIPIS